MRYTINIVTYMLLFKLGKDGKKHEEKESNT